MSIRVAIVGGGLAGTILANALAKHAHLSVQMYEANAAVTERGASVGLSVNAQRALRLIGLEDVTRRADAVRVGCLQIFVGEGEEAGEMVCEVDFGKETVHRAALLRELMVGIPEGAVKLNKRLVAVEGTTMKFADGSEAVADVIVGADGIHSGVRRFVLGEGHPAINPVPAGFWDARTVVSRDEAVTKLGASCFDMADPHQHIHIGSKGVLFHDLIDEGQRVCIVATGPVPPEWDLSQWTQKLTRKWLYEQYAGWGEFGRNGIDLLLEGQEEKSAFVQWESAQTPTYCREAICMMGDAAHATSPWQGTGLSQAIEDALILETVLGRCTHAQEVPLALQVFDRVRREHSQRTVESSRKAGESYFRAHEGGGEQLRKKIPSREYILNWDTQGAVQLAVDSFEQARQSDGFP